MNPILGLQNKLYTEKHRNTQSRMYRANDEHVLLSPVHHAVTRACQQHCDIVYKLLYRLSDCVNNHRRRNRGTLGVRAPPPQTFQLGMSHYASFPSSYAFKQFPRINCAKPSVHYALDLIIKIAVSHNINKQCTQLQSIILYSHNATRVINLNIATEIDE